MGNSTSNYGVYIPTTNIWDVSNVESADIKDPGLKELLIRLYQNLNLMALAVNNKDSGFYNTLENVNNQLYFSNPALTSQTALLPTMRQVYRTVVNCGALPSSGTPVTVAHNIAPTASYTFTRIYGCASDTAALTYIPLPYVSASSVTNNIQLSVTSTNVVITSGGTNYSAYGTSYVVLEYIKF